MNSIYLFFVALFPCPFFGGPLPLFFRAYRFSAFLSCSSVWKSGEIFFPC